MFETVLACIVLLSPIALIVALVLLRRVKAKYTELQRRFAPVVDAEQERQRVMAEVAALQGQRAVAIADTEQARAGIARLRAEFAVLDEESSLQSFALYKPRYAFASSERYQSKLEEVRERQKRMLKDKTAATCAEEWSVNGSKVEGRKQINQTLKLMLRAFNGECDATIAKVRYNNVSVMEARTRKAWEVINGCAEVQRCTISSSYLDLKLQELYLVHEYEEKLQQEKEEQRRIKEQMREEEQAQRELEKAKQDAEREEARFAEALKKAQEEILRVSGAKQQKLLAQVAELERKLSEAQANKARAVSRAQMTRSGHVYIISNIGSFGEHVYKIGMTRRLDPMDRVKELGDASVPFEFDVHAIIYTEDAPKLENELHRAFHHRRVNRVNERKEFFNVSLVEIAEHVRRHHASIEIVLEAEAMEYRKTLSMAQGAANLAPDPKQALVRPAASVGA
ncbi:DUF4041 domain-containing protein [Nannocystis sp. ILAH1]|uniref:DUF4041 domain-containing protein n=1 Tax=Nannocystis sp. ILAH1 TaxID=2996789 RepID=UPI00227140F8|nr:DUF4041 domain-containing protein [Nannocystis sp. ILAH1]MCY0993505.1 DUF4041 domain-containing protein [Nannocystis sp. ILAH1]